MPQKPSRPEVPHATRREPRAAEQDRIDASTPGRDALRALARLLGRQAAREQMRSQGGEHGA